MSQSILEMNIEALRKVSPALAAALSKADGGP